MTPQTATLLVLTSQANEAERLITSLRNGGLAVRGMYSAHASRIADLAERRACDILVCCAYDPEVDLETVLAHHRDIDTDLPLIVVTDHHSEPSITIQAMRGGARDVTERDDHEHLQLVVARELADLRQRAQAIELAQRLMQCEQRSRDLLDSTEEAVGFVQDGLHVHANPAYLRLFGLASVDDLQACTFLDLIQTQQRQPVRDFLRTRESGDDLGVAEFHTTCTRPDASTFTAHLFASVSELEGEKCLRIIVRQGAQAILANGSALDPSQSPDHPGYTTLIAAITERIGSTRQAKQPFVLFYIQVRRVADLFRELGLSRGLDVIRALNATLGLVTDNAGIMAQISDSGFGLLVDHMDEDSAQAMVERIRADVALNRPRDAASRTDPDCDVGYVMVSDTTAPAIDLIDRAHAACIGANEGDKETAISIQKPTSLATREKLASEDGDDAMATKIQYALSNDHFILVYQPIVSLLGDSQENYSVLVRLIDEDENLLEARDFIEPAIRHGLIQQIDKWAIRRAIQTMAEHRQADHALNFFINLAEDSFQDPGILIWICDCLREFDVRGSWLTFVFQEELVAGNLGSLSKLIEGLKKIKCRVAVNRFGGNERSQTLFQGILLDFVLLLPDYAVGLADDTKKQQKLLSLANLAREYNVKSVVTGVEDARALTILWTAGVDYVQGNFLQRPSPTLDMGT